MITTRSIANIYRARPAIEGGGVRLRRAFGFGEVPAFAPFLLLDDFNSDNPDDYRLGFPQHPHRGIETVTYMITGAIRHEDSLGNGGVIRDGDVQWMTAGSGIIHSEMPDQADGLLRGLQLWINLPARLKMAPPRYREIQSGVIPEAVLGRGVRAKIIAGEFSGVQGPVRDIAADPLYMDIALPAGADIDVPLLRGYTAFAYVLEGSGTLGPGSPPVEPGTVALFSDGDRATLRAGRSPFRLLIGSGRPTGEPIAWEGPIVMNTDEELRTAFEEYFKGTFIKHGKN